MATSRPPIALKGLKATKQALRGLGSGAVRVTAISLYQLAEEIMTTSKSQYVPVDLGTLRASGYVERPTWSAQKVSVTLGFGGAAAPYALAVHENPRAGKTGGRSPSGRKYYGTYAKVGSWKYLELPYNAAMDSLDERLARGVRRVIRSLRK